MQHKVKEIISDIIKREGGYVDHPNDRGGPTKYGITMKTLSSYLKRKVTADEVRGLSYELAFEILYKEYCEGPRIHTLPDDIQPVVTDACVLYGPKRAIIFLQNIVSEAGFGLIAKDGILGPDTRGRVETAYEKMGPYFINAYVEERIMFFERIVANNPSQSVFIKGWTNRANEFRV